LIRGWLLLRRFFYGRFQRADVTKSIAQHVVKLGLLLIISGFFYGSFRFGHGGTHFTHMARLK
jgi:hypothetical protein